MFRFLSRWLGLILLASTLVACEEAASPADESQGPYDPDFGFFVTHEGNVLSGTVSYYSRQRNTMANDIYAVANNGAALGDLVQSMTLRGDRGYVVATNSNVVRIVNANTFGDQGSLQVTLPRYVHIASDTAGYISQYGEDFDTLRGRVRVFNPTSHQVGRNIPLTISSGRMLRVGSELWVLPELGGRRIARINLSGHVVIGYLNFASPVRGGVVDNSGRVWIANGSQLARLSSAGAVDQRITFASNISHLSIGNGGTVLYFQLADGVYRAPVSLTSAANAQRIIAGRTFNALAWDGATEQLLGAVSPSFTMSGRVVRFNSTTGAVADSFSVGIAPNGFALR